MKLRAGDRVTVRTQADILATLDKRGRLDEMPFMPQMFQYCGQEFKVYKRAHKTCDTVHQTGGRRLSRTVHLELRCDGQAYEGCQAACLIFWKTAWLNPVRGAKGTPGPSSGPGLVSEPARGDAGGCTEADVWAGTREAAQASDAEPQFVCQATRLPYFTTLLPWWDFRQYLEDLTSGNITLGRFLGGFAYACYNVLAGRARLGRPFRRLYDVFQGFRGGSPYPRRVGIIPEGQKTPGNTLDLQPGELVRVKPYQDILETLDSDNKNRGLAFDAELVPYCGGVYRVRQKVTKYIDEKTGKIAALKNPAIILEDVWCQSKYSDCRMFCPRSIYSWWREAWLERVEE